MHLMILGRNSILKGGGGEVIHAIFMIPSFVATDMHCMWSHLLSYQHHIGIRGAT